MRQLVQRLLNHKPQLAEAYFNVGLKTVFYTSKVLGVYMKHLLLLKGLDPNTIPGLKAHNDMVQGLIAALTKRHESSYDADFDFSWAHKKWAENRKKLEDMNVSEQQFVATTDLSRVDDAPTTPVTDEPLTVGFVDVNEENFGTVQPSAPDPIEEELNSVQQDIQRDRERENHLEEIARKIRLKKLAQILDEGILEDEFPFNPKVDLPALVERGKALKEIGDAIKARASRVRDPSKFRGHFKRSK